MTQIPGGKNSSEAPGREHYVTSYLGGGFERLYSYQQQLAWAVADKPASVLLIGKGDGIVEVLLEGAGIAVTTLDIVADLKPDVVGSVESIPSADASFDTALCCQVLEHIPFDRFQHCLAEIRRVTRNRLVLSIPDIRRFASVRFDLAGRHAAWQATLPRFAAPAMPTPPDLRHGHYWEIGFKGYPIRRVRDAIQGAGWRILDTARVYDLSWHTFFLLQNGQAK